jgi:hypothetical protein
MTKQQPKTIEFLQTVEVARRLDITPTRVGQLVRDGEIKVATKLGDGSPLFAPDHIEKVKQARIDKLIQRVERLKST